MVIFFIFFCGHLRAYRRTIETINNSDCVQVPKTPPGILVKAKSTLKILHRQQSKKLFFQLLVLWPCCTSIMRVFISISFCCCPFLYHSLPFSDTNMYFPVSFIFSLLINWTSSRHRLWKLSLNCLRSLLSASLFDWLSWTGTLCRNCSSLSLEYFFIACAFCA